MQPRQRPWPRRNSRLKPSGPLPGRPRRSTESERAADAERRAAQDAQSAATLAQIAGNRDALQQKLSATSAALDETRTQHVRAEADARATLERTVEAAASARREAEESHAAERAAAASQVAALQAQSQESAAQTAAREAEFEARLATAATSLAAAEQQVEALHAAARQVQAQFESERAADAERRAAQDAEAAAALAKIAASRDALQQQLIATSTALEESRAQHVRAETDARATLERTVEAAARARREAEELHAAERATAASQFAALQTQAEEASSQAAAARIVLERQLSDTAAALEQARAERTADLTAAAHRLASREAEFELQLAAAVTSRAVAEQQIEALRATLQQTRLDYDSERAADAERLAAQAAEAAATLAQIAGERDAAQQQVIATSAAFEESRTQHARAEADARATLERTVEAAARAAREAAQRLAERESALGAMLDESTTARGALEARLDDSLRAAQRAEQLGEAERQAARAREQSLQDGLGRETQARTSVERELTAARAEFARGRRRLLEAASALRRRTIDTRARLEAQIASERDSHERRLAERETTIRDVELEREALRQSLDAMRGQLQELSDRYDQEREEFERLQSAGQSQLQHLSAEYDQTRQSLEQLRTAFDTLERVSSEHALDRARLETVVADRDAQLNAQAASHLAAELAGHEALARVEETLRQTVATKDRDIHALEHEREALRQQVEAASREGDALRRDNERLPILQRQLDASQAETRRQFTQAPYSMCRVTRDGVLVAANQALAKILGYRSTDDLAQLDFAASVFEAPADLHWLVARAASGGSATLETIWQKQDRTRLTVRLQVVRTTDEWIEVCAEDVTQLRTTEENLRQARHMEAVGRLASEVAVTCDAVLRGVSHGGQYWLAAMDSDLALRHQGEQLLGDVAHATSLLQRLAAYGNEQSDALEPVNLQRVLRNIEPVLKRVTGDDVEVALPKHVHPYTIDVERTRVERVLVNAASYARERMPQGGHLKIDLASTVVDRAFLDKYPTVRPGPHVIVTITEERRATPAGLPIARSAGSGDESATSVMARPAVDLSALMRLLGECGGHLWVSAGPPGNMTLKIHLPMRASDAAARPVRSLARPGAGRTLGRWFRH